MHANKDRLIGDLIAEVLEHHPATRSLDLAFSVGACRLYSNSAGAIARLESHYQAFATAKTNPAFLVTVIQCAPVTEDDSYRLHVPGERELIVGAELVDKLDERLEFDRATGLLRLHDHGRYLLIGPCLEQFDAIVSVIYDLYLEWKWRLACEPAAV